MGKFKLIIVVGVTVGLGVYFAVLRQAQVRLREENVSLKEQLERAGQWEEDNQTLSNRLLQAEASAKENLAEVLRLRGEVGMLRRQTNELQKLREQNQQLGEALKAARMSWQSNTVANPPPAPPPPPLAVYPRASWAFAGFASPEAAFQSLNWAMSNGDLNTVLANCTPEMQKELAKQMGTNDAVAFAEEQKERINKNTEVSILSRTNTSDHEVVLEILGTAEGMNSPDKVVFQNMNGQWKLAPESK